MRILDPSAPPVGPRPLHVTFMEFDIGETLPGREVVVELDASGLLDDGGDLVSDVTHILLRGMSTAASAGLDISKLVCSDIRHPELVSIPWDIRAEWGGDGGTFGTTVTAQTPMLAELGALEEMMASTPDAMKTGTDYVNALILRMNVSTVHPPIPRIAGPDDFVDMLKAVASVDLPETARLQVGEALATLDGANDFRAGPPDAADGEAYLAVTTTHRAFDAERQTIVFPRSELEAALADPANEIDGVGMFLTDKAKSIASRVVDYDSFDNDSDYLEAIDKAVETMTACEFGVAGPTRSFSVDATWWGDPTEGPWSDTVEAIDEADAEVQAAKSMAVTSNRGIAAGEEGFRQIEEAIASHTIHVAIRRIDVALAAKALDACAAIQDHLSEGPARAAVDQYLAMRTAYESCLARDVDAAPAPGR